MTFEEWNDKHWKVNVRERDGEKSYALNAPSTTYIFNEHDLLQLAHNINSIAEHIYDNEFYYIHDGNIFKRTGGQLFGVIDDCEELNRLHNENESLKQTINDNKDFIADVIADCKRLQKENEQLKEALREELQDNGNAYYIEIFDKLFNLNYDEWDRNERYRECTDWEKVLKDKGDME